MDRLDREEYGVDETEEALMAHTIANTNVLTVLLYRLAQKGLIDRTDLNLISSGFSKPLDLSGPRENRLMRQMQDQFDAEMARIIAVLDQRG